MFTRLPIIIRSALILAAVIMSASAAAAQTYVFDKKHTEIRFSWDHFGLSRTAAYFKEYDGEATYDAAAPEKSTLEIKIKSDSVQAISLGAEGFLKESDWLASEKFPEITFKSTKIEKTGEKTGKISGDLTIKGVTRPVTLDATLNFAGPHPFSKKPSLGISASTTVKRSNFDMGKYIPAVSDDVKIQIEAELNAKS